MNETKEMTWKDWTREDWDNASYCENCGLPLLEVKAEENAGGYICVYCEWISDEEAKSAQMTGALERIISKAEKWEIEVETKKGFQPPWWNLGDIARAALGRKRPA